jgi:hypothetical protein
LKLNNSTKHSLPCITTIGKIEIAVAPIEYLPLGIDAIVEEQDTQLLMAVDTEIEYPDDDFDTLINQMTTGKARRPGQIIVKQDKPIRFQAIIHDINHDPSWKVEWIALALKQLVEEIENYQIKSLAMPLLGTHHGKMAEEESIELLCASLATDQASLLENLWLIAPDPICNRIKDSINNFV